MALENTPELNLLIEQFEKIQKLIGNENIKDKGFNISSLEEEIESYLSQKTAEKKQINDWLEQIVNEETEESIPISSFNPHALYYLTAQRINIEKKRIQDSVDLEKKKEIESEKTDEQVEEQVEENEEVVNLENILETENLKTFIGNNEKLLNRIKVDRKNISDMNILLDNKMIEINKIKKSNEELQKSIDEKVQNRTNVESERGLLEENKKNLKLLENSLEESNKELNLLKDNLETSINETKKESNQESKISIYEPVIEELNLELEQLDNLVEKGNINTDEINKIKEKIEIIKILSHPGLLSRKVEFNKDKISIQSLEDKLIDIESKSINNKLIKSMDTTNLKINKDDLNKITSEDFIKFYNSEKKEQTPFNKSVKHTIEDIEQLEGLLERYNLSVLENPNLVNEPNHKNKINTILVRKILLEKQLNYLNQNNEGLDTETQAVSLKKLNKEFESLNSKYKLTVEYKITIDSTLDFYKLEQENIKRRIENMGGNVKDIKSAHSNKNKKEQTLSDSKNGEIDNNSFSTVSNSLKKVSSSMWRNIKNLPSDVKNTFSSWDGFKNSFKDKGLMKKLIKGGMIFASGTLLVSTGGMSGIGLIAMKTAAVTAINYGYEKTEQNSKINSEVNYFKKIQEINSDPNKSEQEKIKEIMEIQNKAKEKSNKELEIKIDEIKRNEPEDSKKEKIIALETENFEKYEKLKQDTEEVLNIVGKDSMKEWVKNKSDEIKKRDGNGIRNKTLMAAAMTTIAGSLGLGYHELSLDTDIPKPDSNFSGGTSNTTVTTDNNTTVTPENNTTSSATATVNTNATAIFSNNGQIDIKTIDKSLADIKTLQNNELTLHNTPDNRLVVMEEKLEEFKKNPPSQEKMDKFQKSYNDIISETKSHQLSEIERAESLQKNTNEVNNLIDNKLKTVELGSENQDIINDSIDNQKIVQKNFKSFAKLDFIDDDLKNSLLKAGNESNTFEVRPETITKEIEASREVIELKLKNGELTQQEAFMQNKTLDYIELEVNDYKVNKDFSNHSATIRDNINDFVKPINDSIDKSFDNKIINKETSDELKTMMEDIKDKYSSSETTPELMNETIAHIDNKIHSTMLAYDNGLTDYDTMKVELQAYKEFKDMIGIKSPTIDEMFDKEIKIIEVNKFISENVFDPSEIKDDTPELKEVLENIKKMNDKMEVSFYNSGSGATEASVGSNEMKIDTKEYQDLIQKAKDLLNIDKEPSSPTNTVNELNK